MRGELSLAVWGVILEEGKKEYGRQGRDIVGKGKVER